MDWVEYKKWGEKAVQWGKIVLQRYNLDTVWLQKVMVPHWVRGDVERLDFISSSTEIYQSNCSALVKLIGCIELNSLTLSSRYKSELCLKAPVPNELLRILNCLFQSTRKTPKDNIEPISNAA